jgi:phenylacetate-CoA ligase
MPRAPCITGVPKSAIESVAFPAVPDPVIAQFLALCWQLEQSQWWSPAELRRQQERQLALLVAHAAATVPHYQETFAAAGYAPADGVGPAAWARIPILARQALIAAGPRIASTACPPAHGAVREVSTSRTSGEPVRVKASALLSALWEAVTLREHAWHHRDLTARLAVIRHVAGDAARAPDGVRAVSWGPATAVVAPNAPVSALSVAATTDQQVAWLLRENPTYLLVYPTVLDAICRRLQGSGQRLPALREVRTISEALSPATRAIVREVLGVRVVDTYSAQEIGYIALQCPDRADGDERYHVQAEHLLVEILAADGTPCAPGEIGRVVVTDLHNFATPLLRYEINDYAEVGEPCTCGRGLPVLTRIVGRRRGMLVYPDGRTAWPVFSVACREATRFRDLQLVQDTVYALRVRVVPEPDFALDEDERRALVAALHRVLGYPFTVTVEEVSELARTPAGKLEEFVSHVPAYPA